MTTATARAKIRKPKVWSEEEYLDLPGDRLVEFDHGRLEVLPMPGDLHQTAVFNLHLALHNFALSNKLGRVLASPLPVKVADQKFREPDLAFRPAKHRTDPTTSKFWENVSLVVEVLSPGTKNRQRDQIHKRKDYAAAGIDEFWIIDPKTQEITLLNLQNGEYIETGVYHVGDIVRSIVLSPFEISVESVFSVDPDL